MYKFRSTAFGLIYLYRVYFYRQQRSCGKVMFLHLSVILFTGVCGRHPQAETPLGRHPQADTPPRQTSHPQADTPPPRQTPHPPRQTSPGQTTPQQPPPPGRHSPGRHPPRQTSPPQEMATAADGSHPTGMHSCFLFDSGVLAYPLYGIVILLNCPGVIASVERKVGEISLYPAIIIFVLLLYFLC